MIKPFSSFGRVHDVAPPPEKVSWDLADAIITLLSVTTPEGLSAMGTDYAATVRAECEKFAGIIVEGGDPYATPPKLSAG